MILFTIIFFAMVLAVGASAVLGFSFYLKRRTKLLNSNNQKQFLSELLPYRSLFEPTDEEIRDSEREKNLQIEAKIKDEERQLSAEKTEKVCEFQKVWQNEPNKTNTVELFRLAVESESAQTFSQTAENIIKIWRDEKLTDLTAQNLADLLDSHLRILPQQERTSGALFWLRQEIISLRTKSEEVD